jgi:hypothetical protein
MSRLVLLTVLLTVAACRRTTDGRVAFGGAARPVETVRVIRADDRQFASPSFDDRNWTTASLYQLPRPPASFWLRAEVLLPDGGDDTRAVGIYVSMLAATETFWDGVPVGRSGTVTPDGRFAAAGPIDNLFALTGEAARPGRHVLAIRAASPASAARVSNTFYGLAVGDYERMARSRVAALLMPFAGLGIFVVIGGYYFVIWCTARERRSSLVFAVLCFVAAGLVVAETYRPLFGYSFDRHLVRLHIINFLTGTVALLLPLFLMMELRVKHAARWCLAIAVLLAATAAADSFDSRSLAMFAVSIGASLAIVGVAFAAGRRDYAALTGVAILAVAMILGGYGFGDRIFFLAFAALIACLLVSMALERRRTDRDHQSARLRAARLEIELLKRTLQPHFLMNTLTAVTEWLEEEPREGVRFLQAIGDELRILGEISGERLIPIVREVELCRAHLDIMSFRKGLQFSLVTDGVDRDATIPPAIFHTLLENAISHNRYRGAAVLFTLQERREGATRRYVLDSPLAGRPGTRGEDGIGLRYVKARLEESFPGRWRVGSEALESSWRTTIEVPG